MASLCKTGPHLRNRPTDPLQIQLHQTSSNHFFLISTTIFYSSRLQLRGIIVNNMASRIAVRYIRRRFSTGGRILSEEEKAAENVYIKKTEQEKLEKLARKGPKPEGKPDTGSGGTLADAKPSSSTSTTGASTEKVSTNKYRNYAVLAGVLTFGGALGWYLNSEEKKQEVHD